MEDIDRLAGDYALDRAVENLQQIKEVLPRIQDKLKILEAALSRVAIGDIDQGEVPDVSYGYIPLDLGEFFECIFDLESALAADSDYSDADLIHRRVDFVEAGCGSGRNVFLLGATDRFEMRKIHGFDLSRPLIEHGLKVFGKDAGIKVADCMKYNYAPYDVVYFYRPFSDEDAQITFENQLVENLKTGAYVIGYGNVTYADDRRLLAKCENGRIFKKLR